ncbi:glutathione S-transferase N-terminal domain-containing protein [Aquirhabdus parva]|uniref:Starvation protein A n=1 Tax=Aquirhabdus parva TaxID=2283318 RepID=A0A345P3E3_9GAMM|nr:glutathione S-transferase N-terminal domain-containing protein [Aquirhabdus parva]AXI01802.1 starvation protein A [Aquirhabdus parva]
MSTASSGNTTSLSTQANLPLQNGLFLYAHPDAHHSHRVRLALAEKDIEYTLILVDPDDRPEDLAALNPYNTLPTLVERELRLFESRIILEYLDDRYRQTRLHPDSPSARALVKQYAWRIERDWLVAADILLTDPSSLDVKKAAAARKALTDSLISLSPLFGHQPYFLSDTFGLCDCLLAPVLWRLPQMGIQLTPNLAKPLLTYCQRLFDRPAFVRSLTAQERARNRD